MIFILCTSSILTFFSTGGLYKHRMGENREKEGGESEKSNQPGHRLAVQLAVLGTRVGLHVGPHHLRPASGASLIHNTPQVGAWISKMFNLLVSSLKTLLPKTFVKISSR